MSPPHKFILGFLVRFLCLFLLFMAPWPGLRESYSQFFRATGNAMFGSMGRWGSVRFERRSQPDVRYDTTIRLANRDTRAFAQTDSSSRFMAYIPTAFVVALVLGTPIAWRRRFRALAWGVLLIHLFIGLRMLLAIVVPFSAEGPLNLYALGPFWRDALGFLMAVLVASPAGCFVVPVLVWMLVTLRRSEWDQLFANAPSDTGPGSPRPAH